MKMIGGERGPAAGAANSNNNAARRGGARASGGRYGRSFGDTAGRLLLLHRAHRASVQEHWPPVSTAAIFWNMFCKLTALA